MLTSSHIPPTGGHAAHFANIDQRSPFFSQERAPTSVAYAENQSMFLDALMGDGDWLARYARDSYVVVECDFFFLRVCAFACDCDYIF